MDMKDVLTDVGARYCDDNTYCLEKKSENVKMKIRLYELKPLVQLTLSCPIELDDDKVMNKIDAINDSNANGLLTYRENELSMKCCIWIDNVLTPKKFKELVATLANDLYVNCRILSLAIGKCESNG